MLGHLRAVRLDSAMPTTCSEDTKKHADVKLFRVDDVAGVAAIPARNGIYGMQTDHHLATPWDFSISVNRDTPSIRIAQ